MQVSAVGFSASPLESTFGTIDENEGIRGVHRAIDPGVNFIDVSPYYGMIRAETCAGPFAHPFRFGTLRGLCYILPVVAVETRTLKKLHLVQNMSYD